MITAVDTSILLDVFAPDPEFGPRSKSALDAAFAAGRVVACGVVWAELAAFFPSVEGARRVLAELGIEFDAIDERSALHAGGAWKLYRRRGGKRRRVVADFLIGAHALCRADRLLTRDRGFYRSYFRELGVVDSSR